MRHGYSNGWGRLPIPMEVADVFLLAYFLVFFCLPERLTRDVSASRALMRFLPDVAWITIVAVLLAVKLVAIIANGDRTRIAMCYVLIFWWSFVGIVQIPLVRFGPAPFAYLALALASVWSIFIYGIRGAGPYDR